jgi:hypothetical protein
LYFLTLLFALRCKKVRKIYNYSMFGTRSFSFLSLRACFQPMYGRPG